mgnify:CR=1 FL=1
MPGPGQMRGDGRKAANPGKTLLRLLSYMKNYTPLLVFVFLCIIATSVAQAQGSLWLTNISCPWWPPALRILAL